MQFHSKNNYVIITFMNWKIKLQKTSYIIKQTIA